MKRIIFIVSSVILLVTSCYRKELLEPTHHHGEEVMININVAVDVDEDIDSESALAYEAILKTARSVNIVAYPRDATAMYGVHKIDGLSGSIWLMPGHYDLLIYTSDFYDLDGVYYRNIEKYGQAEAYTTQAKVSRTKVKSYVIEQPDPLFVHLYENYHVVVGENKLESGLDPMSYRYWFEVDVDGLDYISSVYMEIDGMYTSVYMMDGSHNEDEYALQKVETQICKDENKIKGEFFSFGPHQDDSVKNTMVLTFINGRTIRIELDDISPEIKKLKKGGKIPITQKIVINVGDEGSGFDPIVDEWDDEEVIIPI